MESRRPAVKEASIAGRTGGRWTVRKFKSVRYASAAEKIAEICPAYSRHVMNRKSVGAHSVDGVSGTISRIASYCHLPSFFTTTVD